MGTKPSPTSDSRQESLTDLHRQETQLLVMVPFTRVFGSDARVEFVIYRLKE